MENDTKAHSNHYVKYCLGFQTETIRSKPSIIKEVFNKVPRATLDEGSLY